MTEVLCRRPAMATLFEFLLVGEEEEHLAAVGEAALDELERIERMLSMFDPASELARVNREAADHPVKVSRELFDVLAECRRHHERTDGWFDPCVGSAGRFGDSVRLDDIAQTVAFTTPGTRFDLGGYGKGYALDNAARILAEFHIADFLIHGGTSSALACGTRDWNVDLRSQNSDGVVGRVNLKNAGLSSSANDSSGTVVIAETAALAEVWSTAILAMGFQRARAFDYHELHAVGWIDTAAIHWLKGSGT